MSGNSKLPIITTVTLTLGIDKFFQAAEEGAKVADRKDEALQYSVHLKDSVHSGKESVTINSQDIITGVKM